MTDDHSSRHLSLFGANPSVTFLTDWFLNPEHRHPQLVPHRLACLKLLKKQVPQATQSLRLIQALQESVQEETRFPLLNALLDVLGSMRAMAAVHVMIQLAIGGQQVAVFAGAEGQVRLQSEDGLRLRSKAIRLLGLIGDDRALAPLMDLLNDKTLHYRLRLDAAESLGRLGDGHAVQPLLDVMQDERETSVYLKESTVKALGMLGDIRAVQPLLSLLEAKKGFKQKFQFMAEQVLLALGKLSEPADKQVLETLLQAATDRSSTIRLAAVEAMGHTGDNLYLSSLQERLLDESMEVAQAALAGVYKLGGVSALHAVLQLENLPHYLREEILDFLLEIENEPNEG